VYQGAHLSDVAPLAESFNLVINNTAFAVSLAHGFPNPVRALPPALSTKIPAVKKLHVKDEPLNDAP
jgi:hypothetical protein